MVKPDFDINLLRCFLAIAETGSFTIAGQRVGRTQSAVSQRMRRFEELAGCRLFNRGKHAVSLTNDGAAIMHAVQQMVNQNDVIANIVRSLGKPDREAPAPLGNQFIIADTVEATGTEQTFASTLSNPDPT